MNINLSLKELKDLYYCISKVSMLDEKVISNKVLYKLGDKIVEEVVKKKYNKKKKNK